MGEGEPVLGAHTAGRGAELRASYSCSFRNTRTLFRVLPAFTPVSVKHTRKGLQEEPKSRGGFQPHWLGHGRLFNCEILS